MEMSDKMIEEKNELFDSAMREQFAEYEPAVPHGLWNRISSELDKDAEATQSEVTMPATGSDKWKMAIAAAILLTVSIGTLVYRLNPADVAKMNSTAVAAKSTPAPIIKKEIVTPALVAINPAKTTVQSVSHVYPKVATSAPKTETTIAPTPAIADKPAVTTTAPQELTAQDLEFAPTPTENKPMEVGNIPLASLNFLSTPTAVNDEITVIKSVEKKKKHARKNEDESTKVIMIGKKFESQPNIIFQVPVRF